ncbi:MAG TPA: RHS repeat-associated core domain-containing protein, partial [Myxococcales bacterium]|nr:RHS repeat-associated core domain-containing protein [Myxococcales bacterium]
TNDFLVPSEDGSQVYNFDGAGRHLQTIDARTKVPLLKFGYGSDGLLASVADRHGNTTTIARNSTGLPTSIVSPYGHRTSLALDANGFLASVTNPAGETTTLTSSTGGLLKTLTDARGFMHAFLYDALGRLAEDDDPAGGSKTLRVSGTGSDITTTLTTKMGRTQSYEVNAQPSGVSLRTNTATDGTRSTVQLFPNASSSVSTADGMVESTSLSPDPRFGMNAALATTSTTTPAGLRRSATVSRSVSLTAYNNPLSLTSLTEMLTVNGQSSTSRYDAATATITTTSAGGRRTVQTLDALGRVAQVQLPGVLPISTQYDSHGRPIQVVQGTRTYGFSYDAQSNLASLTDPLGRTRSFVYDMAGRATKQTLPDGRTIAVSYDASGNVTSVTPPGRPAHSFAYTPVDLEQSYAPPLLGFFGSTLTSYNLDKQVSLVSRPAGDTVVPSYDSAGRLASLTTSWGSTSYSYSPTTGQLAQITAPDLGKLSYTYDGSMLTDTSWSGTITGTVHRSYDNFFRVASESVSGGQAVSYQYDADGLLTAAGALQIQRDPATGFSTGSTLGGVVESRTYDAFGAEATYTASFRGGSLFDVSYTRDAAGRITSKTERVGAEAAHTFSYGYDFGGRLSDASKDGIPTPQYAYDPNGNRIAGPGLTSSPVYDGQDRLTSYGACTYAYKADGSPQTKTCPGGATTYDYDAFGNLRHVTLPNATHLEYVIDGQNRRIGKKVNGLLVEGFLYREHLKPVLWLTADGSVKAQFIYGSQPNVPEHMVRGTSTYRLIADQVGSVRLVVDTSNGAIVERIDYDEFGNVLTDTAPGTTPFGFAGGLRDRDTGLTRFGARDYDPVTGTWTAKDPLRFDGGLSNLYSYVGGDPVNKKDPSGRVGPISFTLAAVCGAYEIYDFASTSVEVARLGDELNDLHRQLKPLKEKCLTLEGSEEDLKEVERLEKQIYIKGLTLASKEFWQYPKAILTSFACLAIAALPF